MCTPPRNHVGQKLLPHSFTCCRLFPGTLSTFKKLTQRALPPPGVELPAVQLIAIVLARNQLYPLPILVMQYLICQPCWVIGAHPLYMTSPQKYKPVVRCIPRWLRISVQHALDASSVALTKIAYAFAIRLSEAEHSSNHGLLHAS